MIRTILKITLLIMIAGLLVPQQLEMPVEGANTRSYNKNTFWYYSWGKSRTHKGVDIFADRGTPVHSSTIGLVLYTGSLGRGGNVAVVLGPKWRFHYYAHLDRIDTRPFSFVNKHSPIGTVGNTGNAQNTPAHLHYSVATVLPYVWQIDDDHQGWMKMFYLNPIDFLQ